MRPAQLLEKSRAFPGRNRLVHEDVGAEEDEDSPDNVTDTGANGVAKILEICGVLSHTELATEGLTIDGDDGPYDVLLGADDMRAGELDLEGDPVFRLNDVQW